MSIHSSVVTLTGSHPVQAMLPPPLESETQMLLRAFLLPLIETAASWGELRNALGQKGYDIALRRGRMVLIKLDTGEAICTGRALGAPFKELSTRLGRPSIKLHAGGLSADLSV